MRIDLEDGASLCFGEEKDPTRGAPTQADHLTAQARTFCLFVFVFVFFEIF